MSTRVLLPHEDHREAMADLLTCPAFRLHILCHHVHDTQVYQDLRLRRLLIDFLADRRRVIMVIGEDPTALRDPRTRLRVTQFLKELIEWDARIYLLPSLHAKLLRSEEDDGTKVLITSANITKTALFDNLELGVYICDSEAEDPEVLRFIHLVMSHNPTPLEEILQHDEGG